jgi:hypothetical protein
MISIYNWQCNEVHTMYLEQIWATSRRYSKGAYFVFRLTDWSCQTGV